VDGGEVGSIAVDGSIEFFEVIYPL